ncbi:MAG: hypothetical protein CL917_10755 [Deltaproteobacteria bacterium]|nr:hypothetical protein [Deltaproteobacteria bacterium]
MSLRQKKQRQQRAEIIENAVALFRLHGVQDVRTADIAHRCEISEATFFNYFASQNALLREWASDFLELELSRISTRTAEGGTLRRAIRSTSDDLAQLVTQDLPLQTAAWSRVCAGYPDPAFVGARGREEDRDSALTLILRAQERGECRSDVEASHLASLLRGVMASTLASWLATPTKDRPFTLQENLVQACDLLLDGFRKRNERVAGTG